MPVCRLFLRGLCLEPACAFAHVHLGAAAVCRSFARCGYCDAGAACELRHEQSCDAYKAGGSCALGERCKLRRSRGQRLPDGDGTADQAGGRRVGEAENEEYEGEEEVEGSSSEGGDGDGGDGDGDTRWREGRGAIFGRDSFSSFSVAPRLARESSICPQLDSPVAISAARRESSVW